MKLASQFLLYIGLPTLIAALMKLYAIPTMSWWWLAFPIGMLAAIILIILCVFILVDILTH